MIAIQLWRWFLFHVGFGSIPIVSAVLFPLLFLRPPQVGQPNAGEVLFLAIMLSSLTFGDVLEEVSKEGLNNLRLGLMAVLLLGIGLSLLLYGASIQNQAASRDEGHSLILWTSGFLAVLFFTLGTLVQWIFWKNKKKKGDHGAHKEITSETPH